MRHILFAALMIVSFSLTANNTDPIIHTDTKKIKTETSTVVWTGKKVTGQHTGNINIKSGDLIFDHGKLVGGAITIDMNSIVCTDLGKEGGQKLVGHLKSDEFFGVPNHPTALLKITNVSASKVRGSYDITADITIKGITKSISFSAIVGASEATANVIINRTDFGIKYGSGSFYDNLGDKAIYDNFDLALVLSY